MPRTLRACLLLAAALALAGCAGPFDDSAPSGPQPASVVRVVDGDTLIVRLGSGERERVRVIGIDTPEDVAPDRPVQCWSREAAAFTKRQLEGRDVVLVRGGFARTIEIAPNTDRATGYRRLERTARRAGAGLWGACPDAAL